MTTKTELDTAVGGQAILLLGLVFGLFVVGPLARAFPVLVNGFLTLILFSSLLYNRDRWLPWFKRFAAALDDTGGKGGGGGKKRA